MALNTAPTSIEALRAVSRGRRGIPTLVTLRATEVADLEDEAKAGYAETIAVLRDIRRHAGHIHLAVRAERPDLALHKAGAIATLADRRLRQLGDFDDAA